MTEYIIVSIHGPHGPVAFTETNATCPGSAIQTANDLMIEHKWYAVGLRPKSSGATRLSYVNLLKGGGVDLDKVFDDANDLARITYTCDPLPMRDNPVKRKLRTN